MPVDGKIGLMVDHVPPHETQIYNMIKSGAIAVLAVRVSTNADEPGVGMYFIDGSDRTRLTIPVVESLVNKKNHPFFEAVEKNPEVQMHPTLNRVKQFQ